MPEKQRLIAPRNSRVPYPDQILHTPNGELENYFLGGSDLVDFYNRPQTITSTRFDVYANWLHSLQFTDPNSPEDHERGTTVLFKWDPKDIAFPRNPNVGSRTNNRVGVRSMFHIRNPNYHPLMLIHSHFDACCHSPEDLEIPIMDHGIWGDENDFLGNIIGAKRQNFMLLRTQQSKIAAIEQVEKRTKEANLDIQLLIEQRSTEIRKLLNQDSHYANTLEKFILRREKQIFGADFVRYFASMAHTLNIAEEFKLGFYVSNKDGLYRLVQPNVLDILQELDDYAVNQGIADLRKISAQNALMS